VNTQPDRAAIASLVITTAHEAFVMAHGDAMSPPPIGETTRLIGREALFDSMGLVNLIVDIEQRLEEQYQVAVILADERAMSQKNSPFRSIQTLTDYICQLMAEQ
jgi:acyl carrier protein